MLLVGPGHFLPEKSLERYLQDVCSGPGAVVVHEVREVLLPCVQDGFPESAPKPVQSGCERDGALDGCVFGQHDNHMHL